MKTDVVYPPTAGEWMIIYRVYTVYVAVNKAYYILNKLKSYCVTTISYSWFRLAHLNVVHGKRVCTYMWRVESQIINLPFDQGIIVIPSTLFPSPLQDR